MYGVNNIVKPGTNGRSHPGIRRDTAHTHPRTFAFKGPSGNIRLEAKSAKMVFWGDEWHVKLLVVRPATMFSDR